MIIDRIYRDEIDDREWNRTGKDDYFNSLLVQIQISPADPHRAQVVSGLIEYFVMDIPENNTAETLIN